MTENRENHQDKVGQKNVLQKAIQVFGDVFVPIIPVLIATGIFMGLRGLLTQEPLLKMIGLTTESISPNFIMYTEVLTDTAFTFLPALVAWSAFKVFGGSPILGIVLGLMLVSPVLPNAYQVAAGIAEPILFFGVIPVVGYQGTVLPAFIAGLIGAKIEQKVRKTIPDYLDLLITPFVTLLVMSMLSLFVIGPIFHSFETVLLNATIWVLELPFGLAGILIGGTNQLFVVTGVHHIFNFLEVQLLANAGGNPFNAIVTTSCAAQGGAALAVGMKTKSKKVKALAYPSMVSALLGISEPALFGVNLRYVKPFIFGLVGGAVGGFFSSLFQLAGTGMAVTVIPGALLYLNNQIFAYLFVNAIGFFVAFSLTYVFGFKEELLPSENKAISHSGLE